MKTATAIPAALGATFGTAFATKFGTAFATAACAAALGAALAVALAVASPAAAKPKVDRARAETERACYLDAKALCADAIPDEAKVTACFTAKRRQLSPACGTIFDKGI